MAWDQQLQNIKEKDDQQSPTLLIAPKSKPRRYGCSSDFPSDVNEAARILLKSYSIFIKMVATRIGVRHLHDQEEILQQVSLAFVGELKVGNPIHAVPAWIKQVTVRTSLDMLRSQARRHRRETAEYKRRTQADELKIALNPDAPDIHMQRLETALLVKLAVNLLPGNFRKPLSEQLAGKALTEIAKQFSVTPEVMGMRLHRAKKALKKIIIDLGRENF